MPARLPLALLATAVLAALLAACGGSGPAEPTVRACRPGEPHPGPESPLRPPPGPPSEKLVIAIDGGYGEWSNCEIRQRAALGAAVTRHEWLLEEPVDAQDALVLRAARDAHTRIHALLGANELGDPDAYRDFVVAFIRRYGLGGSFWRQHPELDESRYAITSFELGNEPYLGGMSAAEYAEAVRPALEAVRRLAVPAQTVLVSGVDGDEDTGWLETLYEDIPDLNPLFTGFAIHPYSFGQPPSGEEEGSSYRQIEDLRAAMDAHGAAGKPIFVTEYGESTADCGPECADEPTQAEYLRQVIDGAASHPAWGVAMVSVFQLIDRGTDTDDRELGFGILRQNGSRKPSYAVVEGAMRRYRG